MPSKAQCIMQFLKEDSNDPPKVSEMMELKKSVSQAEWDGYYDQLPDKYKVADK